MPQIVDSEVRDQTRFLALRAVLIGAWALLGKRVPRLSSRQEDACALLHFWEMCLRVVTTIPVVLQSRTIDLLDFITRRVIFA